MLFRSYLAVYGIVFLQPKIAALWKIRNVIFLKVWEFTAVAIAAQLMTLPVSLYLFGQFPNYFLIANWIVIPMSTVAIYLSIAQIVFQKSLPILSIVSYCNEKIICWMNAFLKMITEWPGAVANNLSISLATCLLFYIMLFAIAKWIGTKKFNSLILFLSTYAVLLVIAISNEL